MRGYFSIEWMAQSSQLAATEIHPATAAKTAALNTSGTNSESLPGFYCRPKGTGNRPIQESRGQAVDPFPLSRLADTGTFTSNCDNPQDPHSQQALEAGFHSGTEEETSGYESEGGRSRPPSAPSHGSSASPPSPPAGRRPRTAFTAEQVSSLERAFKRNAYLGTQEKSELCKKLNLSDKQIRNWFQNRRMKLKRTVQDALAHACQANVASQFLHYPELQGYRPGPYPRYNSAQEGPVSAHRFHPHSLQYSASAAVPGVSALPLESFYQYTSLPGIVLPSGSSHLMGNYQPYPQHY